MKENHKKLLMSLVKGFVLPFVIIVLSVLILGKITDDQRERDTEILNEEGCIQYDVELVRGSC